MPVKETALSSATFDQLRLAMATDPVGFATLYRDYLADAWQLLQNLQANVHEREFSTVQPRAHSLKGSSLLFGANVVARHAARFEDAVIATSFGNASTVLEEMQQALRDVQLELVDRLGPDVLPSGETTS